MLKWQTLASLVIGLVLAGMAPASAQTLSAADHLEIQQLYARYNHTMDGGDAEGWADTFGADGMFRNATGRDALVEFATNLHKNRIGIARHWNTNLVVTPTAEGADGTCYFMLWNTGVRPPTITVSGKYNDKLVKTADGWRFKMRSTVADEPAASRQ